MTAGDASGEADEGAARRLARSGGRRAVTPAAGRWWVGVGTREAPAGARRRRPTGRERYWAGTTMRSPTCSVLPLSSGFSSWSSAVLVLKRTAMLERESPALTTYFLVVLSPPPALRGLRRSA